MSPGGGAGEITINHYDSNGTWVIALEGEHDLSTAPLVEARTNGVWPRCTVAVVDVSQATFVDSSVISWLMKVRDVFETPGHEALRVVHGSPRTPAARLLHLLGLQETLACFRTRDDALANLTIPPEEPTPARAVK